MAKAYSGRDGQLLLGSKTLVKVIAWNLQADLQLLETTSLGNSFRTYVPGIQGFTGSATLFYYKGDDGINDAGTLLAKLVNTNANGVAASDAVTLTLRLADGATNSDVTLSAFITNASFGAGVGEVVSAQITFQATGTLATATI
jgi:hypothetical protein